MYYRNLGVLSLCRAVAAIGLIAPTALAYVTPKMGGGQASGSMKHADIYFYSTGENTGYITVHLDETVATPVLRPLTPPDEFDPNQPWSVLGYQAYNYQWAWNPGAPFTLPPGSAIWVERIHQDPELTVYLRTPMYNPQVDGPKWPEIFTADGYRWKWSGAMQHNAYSVCGPYQSIYTVTYAVYLGDAVTGEPLPGYESATVTWTWNAGLVGDMNHDGLLNGADVQAFALALLDHTAYETMYPGARWHDADCNCDGLVDVTDIALFVSNLTEL